jgi:hypothetical protein
VLDGKCVELSNDEVKFLIGVYDSVGTWYDDIFMNYIDYWSENEDHIKRHYNRMINIRKRLEALE